MSEGHSFKFLGGLKSIQDNQPFLNKWSLGDTLRGYKFSFTGSFAPYQASDFLKEFFKNQQVQSAVEVLETVDGKWASIDSKISELENMTFNEVTASAISMEFFDKLYEHGILRENGAIKGCIPEYLDNGMEVHSELTKLILMEESEMYGIFSQSEREEFIFLLFQLMAIGGPLNQYEDSIGPYFDIVKSLYKDCVSVGRNASTKKMHVVASIFKISNLGDSCTLFPNTTSFHPQNACYVCVSPTKKTITVLYNAWCGD
eukprot:m.67091 g.67091  ORF g.67091 m.67091 type:complete len:259 (-) comp8203_c0_seq1:110-886(-)